MFGRAVVLFKYCLWVLLFSCRSFATEPTLHFVTEALPPYQLVENNMVTGGAMVELIQALIAITKVNASIDAYPWPRAYKMALNEPNTLIFSIRKTEEREAEFHWIGDIYRLKTTLAALAERKDIQISTLSDVKNYTIGVVRGDYDELLLKKLGIKGNIYLGLSYKEMWHMLEKKRVDTIMTNPVTAKNAIQELQLTDMEIFFPYEFTQAQNDLFLAANKNTPIELVHKLQQGLQTLKDNGTYQQILQKWGI